LDGGAEIVKILRPSDSWNQVSEEMSFWSNRMVSKSWWSKLAILAGLTGAAWAGTFGKVVAIGGHASDVVLDESRGVVYVANFTANRIDVVSLSDYSIHTSINVAAQPSSMALSPDSRYLVVTNFGNVAAPGTSTNALTVIDLASSGQQTFALSAPPLGVAFGADGRALVVTTSDFLIFDPVLGTTTELDTITGVVAKTLPQPPATFPPTIVAASVTASADGEVIYGLGDTLVFRYDVTSHNLSAQIYTASPPLGPRVVSVSQDGSYFTAGWALEDRFFYDISEFSNPSGVLNVGSTQIDSANGVIYAQVITGSANAAPGSGLPPVMQIVDSDNLTLREQVQLPENLAGKSALSSDGMTMYSVSDSGLMVLPVGSLSQYPRVAATKEDLVFRGNFCNRNVATQTLTVVDPGGGNTPFSISSDTVGLNVNPSSGVTPATITVSVDPNVFQNQTGTVTASLHLQSSAAVNIPAAVRVLINSRAPDQRGTFVDVPGVLVDMLADPARNRFYILRQDKNQVLVFDASSNAQIATLRTGNTPKGMAITFDTQYLLVGCDNAQYLNVYDLDTLQASSPVRIFQGDYVQSIAASSNAILAVTRSSTGGSPTIHRIDLPTLSSSQLPSLGVYNNTVALNTVLSASPNGANILIASSDGHVMLYDANVDSFTASRQDFTALSGSYAASAFGQYVVGPNLLNASLVPALQFENGTGNASGFAFVDQFAFRSTAPNQGSGISSAPGVIQRLDLSNGSGSVSRATRMAEAPLLTSGSSVFTRTLAPLANRTAIINLTVSGFTVLSWNYDASVAPPHIDNIVNAADYTANIAPGGLISVFGEQLSPVNLATSEIPVPTALADSCLTVNGLPVPILFVSPGQINAQMPFEMIGDVTMILRTPGGVSDNFNLSIIPGAPAVFRANIPQLGPTPVVVRNSNGKLVTGADPVHRGDALIIWATGLGQTTPAGQTGLPSPSKPLAQALNVPQITLGNMDLPLIYAGLAPHYVGVYQINVQVPRNVPSGLSVPLVINQGGTSTTIPLRVVE
jgi:uncharacterized protein (TIGR03437 family)